MYYVDIFQIFTFFLIENLIFKQFFETLWHFLFIEYALF